MKQDLLAVVRLCFELQESTYWTEASQSHVAAFYGICCQKRKTCVELVMSKAVENLVT